MLTLVLGGVRSGKSELAERLAGLAGLPVTYLATYFPPPVGDPEMAARVARHRDRRPAGWRTIEAADPLVAFGDDLAGVGPSTLLVDNLSGWLAARMAGDEPVLQEVEQFAATAGARPELTVVVADETGLGGVAGHPVARQFADLSGEACQLLAAAATEVWLVVAGQPLALKGPGRRASVQGIDPADLRAHSDTEARPGDLRAQDDAEPRPEDLRFQHERPEDLRAHGDTEARPGDLDFAVSVLPGGPAPAIAKVLAASLEQVNRYPDDGPATRALAARHSVRPEEVLVVNGAAEAFWLLAGLPVRRAVCVHPSFTEPELALRTRGVPVGRAMRDPVTFTLAPEA
ncbi:MAG: bifunctional adenosylcobinamide kinase/adenosylcobinamide-phosphate guanylyltransferase, partial [Actinomycetota bacterium]